MTGASAVGSEALGAGLVVDVTPTSGLFFDPLLTVISQYANSPIITAIVQAMGGWLDPQARLDLFYSVVWNLDTAEGFGLDILGRIVGIGRVLQVATGQFIGLYPQAEAKPLSQGILFSGQAATSNYALSDGAYRKLILAKAAANITDGSIPSINAILLILFPGYGNSYIIDNGDMTFVIHMGAVPSPVDLTILQASGVLPKGAGVSYTVTHP
jgi:hypothetical protein